MKLRSEKWFNHSSVETKLQHRSAMIANGHIPSTFTGKPMIAIFNSWNDFNSCNSPHKELVEYVKRGVYLGGGYPVEIHTITTPSDFMKPSDLPYRNLMSMDIEEMIRALPIDGVVLLSECDKTTPAQLMGAVSCNLPTLQLAAGHRASGTFRGKKVNYGTDLWHYMDDYRSGKLNEKGLKELEECISCTQGGCPVMGTASTMKSISEMLGLMIPSTSSIPATHAQRKIAAEKTGRRIVEMVYEELTPSKLITQQSLENAVKLIAALGGSTNAVIHLTAIAGRLGIAIDLEKYSALSRDVPLVVNLQPNGMYSMDDFFEAGGLSAVIRQLFPLLHVDCLTALSTTIEQTYKYAETFNHNVISTLEAPFQRRTGIEVVKGNLAPNGAVLKRSASSEELLSHRGRAVVFNNYEEMLERIDRDDLLVDKNSILILRNCGPVAEGMPEWGAIPIPKKLLKQGVRDMVRISDARMSGTSFGTVILHVSPEAAVGGLLAIVEDGDLIELNIEKGSLQLLLDDRTIRSRMEKWTPPEMLHTRGYPRMYIDNVLQAHEGCDLKFLRPVDLKAATFVEPTIGRG